jgi:GntR family transcriptional regulator
MFINAGARALLLRGERQKFLEEEWPRICATIQRLGLKATDLLNAADEKNAKADSKEKER